MAGPAWEGGALVWVLTYALHSTLLLGLAWLAARTVARGSLRWRETLWKTAMVGGLLTSGAQIALDVEPLAGRVAIDAARPSPPATPTVPERAPALAPAPDERPAEREPLLMDLEPAAPEELGFRQESRPAPLVLAPPALPIPLPREVAELAPAAPLAAFAAVAEAAEASASPLPWHRILLALWIAGGLAGLVLLAAAWTRLADLVAGRTPLREGPLFELLAELCEGSGLRRAPRLCVSPRISSPATVGVLRPQICVPSRALSELDVEQQEAMLAHELAHVARRDPQWSFLCRLLERALFFQPLNRVARREIAEIAEYRADDWAVRRTGRGLGLARCLAEVAGWVLERRPAVGLLPMATRGSQLGRRIERLLDGDAPREAAGGARSTPLALGSLALVTLVLPGAAAGASALGGAAEEREPAGESVATDDPVAHEADATDELPLPARGARAELASDIERMIVLLDDEVRELLDEVEALSRTIEENGLQEPFAGALLRVNERVRELRSGKERLQRMIPAVLDLVATAPDEDAGEREDADGTSDVTAP